MEQLGSHPTDFREIFECLKKKYAEKSQVSLKSDKNNRYLA